jgi:hypothetical protein
LLVLEKKTDAYVLMSDGLLHHPSGMRLATPTEISDERERQESIFREQYGKEVAMEFERSTGKPCKVVDADVKSALRVCLLPLFAAMRMEKKA